MGRNQAWCKCRGNLRDFHWNIVHASYKDPWGRKKCDFFLGNFPLPGFQSPHRMTYLTYLGSEAEKVDNPSCTRQKNVPSSKSIFSWLLQQPCTCYYTHHPENWTTERNWHSFTTIPTFFLKNRYNQTKIIHQVPRLHRSLNEQKDKKSPVSLSPSENYLTAPDTMVWWFGDTGLKSLGHHFPVRILTLFKKKKVVFEW